MRLLQFCMITILCMPHCLAEGKIYRSIDARGNVTYSDKDNGKSEALATPEPVVYAPVMPTKRLSPKKRLTTLVKQAKYQSITITSPQDHEVIRSNNGDLSVSFVVKPALDPKHSVQLLLDGTPMQTTKSVTQFKLSNVDRGSHQIQLNIIDDAGRKILVTGESITSTILRYSILNKAKNP